MNEQEEELKKSEEANEEQLENAAHTEQSSIETEESQQPTIEEQLKTEKDKFIRLYAEFENFRRRTAKERLELIGSASVDLMKELLPVVDDFERAVELNTKVEDIVAVKQGFELLHNKLANILKQKGLTPLDSKGDDFDPEIHEAIAQIEAPDKKSKGKVIEVIEKGYSLNEKIIRHPKVVVGT